MIKNMIKILVLLGISIFVLVGCEDETTVTKLQKPKVIEKVETHKTGKIETHGRSESPKVIASKNEKAPDISDVFKDAVTIGPNNKYMVMIFESDDGPYCVQLRKDIYNSKKLKDELKNEFTTYSLDVRNNRMHKLKHEGKDLDADTKTLIDIYQVTSIPTLIFSDKKGKTILVVPGYMPTKQFLVTLDFIKEQKWLGIDRKNGDIYKALKNYYLDHGIDVRKKK